MFKGKLFVALLVGFLQLGVVNVALATNLTGDTVSISSVSSPSLYYVSFSPTSAVVPATNGNVLFTGGFNTVYSLFTNAPTLNYMPAGTGLRVRLGPNQITLAFVNASLSNVTFPESWQYQFTDLSAIFTSLIFNPSLSNGSVNDIAAVQVANNNSFAVIMKNFVLPVTGGIGSWDYTFDITTQAPPVTVPEPATYISLSALLALGICLQSMKARARAKA